MVSDSDIVNRLQELLQSSDLDTTTTGSLRRQLEEDFAVDLTDKKVFIREQVDLYLQKHFGVQEENAEKESDKVKEEEEEVEEEEEEEEVEVEEEEEELEGTSGGKNSSNKRPKKKDKEVKKRGGGFTKLCSLSPELQEFVGVPELARTEVVKQLWKYIRENNLQDPSNKRSIICDTTLRTLFDVDSIDMFQMNKALTKHIWPLDKDDAGKVKSIPKEKQRGAESDEESEEPKRKANRQKGGTSGFLAPLTLSDALAKFLGSGDEQLSRPEVVKRIWNYIKEHNLQDPSDKKIIICDEKLKELFDVDSFRGFTVSKLLTAHFVKTDK